MTTVSEWLEKAESASSRSETAAALAAAEGVADDGYEWADIASAYADWGEDEAAVRRCVVKVLDHTEGEVWSFRRVAEVLSEALEDDAGARDALDRGAHALTQKEEEEALDWCVLAEGYRELLDDDEAVSRCLAEARERGQTLGDLCRLAEARAILLGDKSSALELLREAEAGAETAKDEWSGKNEVHCWWTIANVYKDVFDDEAKARVSLQAGFARVEDVDGCTTLANAWESFSEERTEVDEVRRCLTRGEALAETAEDWVQVAEGYYDFLEGADGDIRRCLARAGSLADARQARRLVADGYRHWLGDDAMADSLAEPGLSPEALASRGRELKGWRRDPGALFEWLRARMTSEAVETIAAADYGQDIDKHRAPLVAIVQSGLIPHPLEWYPLEVLQLTHWGESSKSLLEKAFSATLLALGEAGPEWGHHSSVETTLAILLKCCLALGPEAMDGLVGLLVTLGEARSEEDESESHVFVVLGLLLASVARDPKDERLVALVEEIVALEARLAEDAFEPELERGWLFRYVIMLDSGRKLWKTLAQRVLGEAVKVDPTLVHLARLLALVEGEVR